MTRHLITIAFAVSFILVAAGCRRPVPPAPELPSTTEPQGTTNPDSPTVDHVRDYGHKPTQESLREVVDRAAAKANENAKKFDDMVFVEQAEITRTLRFYDPTKETPDGPIEAGWSDDVFALVDTYALAQQIRYRYEIVSIGPVTATTRPGDEDTHQADIVFKITSTCRWGLAKDEKPIPTPPQGQKIWASWGPRGMWGTGLYGAEFLDLKIPKEAHTTPQTVLERQAVQLLQAAQPVPQEITMTERATYWAKGHWWHWDMCGMVYYFKLEPLQEEPPGREGLTNHGLRMEYHHIGYNALTDKPKRPAATQPSH